MVHPAATRQQLRFPLVLSRYLRSHAPASSAYGLEKKWAYYNQAAIDAAASKPSVRLTPYQMLYAGKFADGSHLVKSAQYLQKELPKRVARRIKDLQSVPYVAAINPVLQEVYELYLRAFHKLSTVKKIENLDEELQYSNLVRGLLDDHKDVVTCLARAFQQVKTQVPYELMGTLIDRTLASRLGIRMLAEHHLGLRQEREHYIGIICTHMSLKSTIEKSVYSCSQLSEHHYGIAPKVTISGHTKSIFPYIQAPLEYILQELLKNSMKATVQKYSDRPREMTPINVTICNNESQFMIKISDRGGGISRSKMENIFKYAFTTTPEEEDNAGGGVFDNLVKASHNNSVGGVMSGYGFGLPTSRAYANFLGGSLHVVPMYGLGTDTYLTLAHIIGQHESFKI